MIVLLEYIQDNKQTQKQTNIKNTNTNIRTRQHKIDHKNNNRKRWSIQINLLLLLLLLFLFHMCRASKEWALLLKATKQSLKYSYPALKTLFCKATARYGPN